MVKITIFIKPFFSVLNFVGVHQSLVNELQIFSFTLRWDELMSFFKNRLVVFDEAHPEPSLLNFWILWLCEMVVRIYFFQDVCSQISFAFSQSIQEYKLGFLGEILEYFEIIWRLLALGIDVG